MNLFRFVRASLLWSAFFAASFFVYVLAAQAEVQMIGPAGLCERFDVPSEKQSCIELVKKKKPDAYVAPTCALMEDDKNFMNCLDFASQSSIDPLALTPCADELLEDAQRMSCLQELGKFKKTAFQSLDSGRKPASKTPAKASKNKPQH